LVHDVVVETNLRTGQADTVVVPAVAGHVARAQGIEHRGVLATQHDPTETTLQSDPGLTCPERCTGRHRAGVRRKTMLDVENALQATAEFLGAADGKTRTTPHAIRHAKVTIHAIDIGVKILQRLVDTAVQHNIRLRESDCRQSCRNGQREKRFLH
jgi:hypothetical protein